MLHRVQISAMVSKHVHI